VDTDDIYKLIAAASAENATLTSLMLDHSPVIKHGGDQRDPTEEITCVCMKKDKWSYNSLPTPYWHHLFRQLFPYVANSGK
jgi:hypothetical protein